MHKEFLCLAIADYNAMFKTNYSIDSKQFENYYKDIGAGKEQEIDPDRGGYVLDWILMPPTLNTLLWIRISATTD